MLLRSNESVILEKKQKNIIFTKLPARLVNIILEMIPPNEMPILRGVCKWFKNYIDSNDNLIAIQVFQLFLPKQVDYFCDFGENNTFIEERVKKNYLISHNTRNQSKWREFLKIFEDVRENFLASNYKIFKISEEFKKNQSNNQQNDLNQTEKQSKLGGLQVLNDPDLSEDGDNAGADLLGLGETCDKNLQEQQEDSQFKFNLGERESEQMEQIENNKDNFFQIRKKQNNDSQDSESNSLKSENQDVFEFDTQKKNVKAQRISQVSSKYIWSVLKDPPLPILKLRRENIGNHCNTWFQNKLAEVLWEGSKQISFGLHQKSEEEQPLLTLNDIIKKNKEYFIKEIKDVCEKWPAQKNDILNIRYYFYKKKSDYSFANRNAQKQKRNSLAKLTSQKSFLDKRSRGFSMIDDNYMKNSTRGAQSQSITNFASEPLPNSNPVVFNFFENKETHDSSNQFNIPQNNSQNTQQQGFFDDIFQFAHKQQEQEIDPLEEIENEMNNQQEEMNLFQTDELRLTKEKPLLLHFVESLIDLLIFKCQLVYEYLKEHMNILHESTIVKKNGFDLLSEYSIMWNSYIAFLTEIEEQTQDVFETFNDAFDQIFEDYPQHPRMSVWRLMVKIWIQEIYSKDDLKQNLFGCFLKILSIRRHENFQFQMKQIELDKKVQQQYYMPDQLEYISLTLLNNLVKNKNFSLLNYGEGYDYFHSFFSKNQYYIDSLLTSFVENTIDLSLNEISIHYLGHSCVQMDSPYIELEKQLLDSSKTYYSHQQNMFIQNPSNYLQFLKGDLKYVSKIFKERSQVLLRKRMFEHWKQMFKDIITQKIPKQYQLFQEKDGKARSLIQQFVNQQISQLKTQQQSFIQNENNLNQILNFSQQNTQSQEGEDQVQQQQNQNPQQQSLQQQQQIQGENQDQPQVRQIGKDIFPALIFKILVEQETKQKQQEQLKIDLNSSKSPSVDAQQLLLQKPNQICLNKNGYSVDGFLTEKNSIFSDNMLSSNQTNLNGIGQEIDENQLNIKQGDKKITATRAYQQYLSNEEQEILQEKAHILAQMFRMSDEQMKTDIMNYIEICRILQELATTKTDQDLEIEEINQTRRLPITLNNEEQTYFFFTKSLTDKIIQETIQKQKAFMRQQREQNAEGESDEEINENQQSQEDGENNNEEEEDDNQDSDNNDDSDDDIPNSLSLKPGQQNQQIKKKLIKAKIEQEQDIPVYNSGDESDSKNYETHDNQGDRQFFIRNQQSNKSDFSLGLDKEQSRISNNNIFADNFNNVQPDKDIIDFKFNTNEPEEEQSEFDPFKMQKQNSGAPSNQMNMFTFKLQSNDVVNMKSSHQNEEKNFFASCTPNVSQNKMNSNNNCNNSVQLNFFSSCNNDNKETNNTQPAKNNFSLFFNQQNNTNNDSQNQSDEQEKDPFKMF